MPVLTADMSFKIFFQKSKARSTQDAKKHFQILINSSIVCTINILDMKDAKDAVVLVGTTVTRTVTFNAFLAR